MQRWTQSDYSEQYYDGITVSIHASFGTWLSSQMPTVSSRHGYQPMGEGKANLNYSPLPSFLQDFWTFQMAQIILEKLRPQEEVGDPVSHRESATSIC